MDIASLRVSHHAMLRYAQRVERRQLDDGHVFTEDERVDLRAKILKQIGRSRLLPPGHVRLPVPDDDADVTYAYDGETCCIIKRRNIKTVIVLDENHRIALNEYLKAIFGE